MTQLQEEENRTSPAATTWAAEFLLRQGESRDILGQWINSSAVHENKRRRATQVITCSFPCRKWLHKLYSRISPFCELCRKEREASGQPADNLPLETVAHIQSAGCKAQKRGVIQAHNSCWKFLLQAIMEHGEAKGEFLSFRLESEEGQDESYADVLFGKRRPDAVILDKPDKTIFVLEFKRTSDQRSDYRKGRSESREATQSPRAKPQESLGKGVRSRAVESKTYHLCRRHMWLSQHRGV